jgi:hypothetical protein
MAPRTRQELDHAIAKVMDLTTHEGIAGWFQHCGYKI